MPVTPLIDTNQELPRPAGHVIGFVNDRAACDAITSMLTAHKIAASKILVFHGDEGLGLFERMLKGYTWGESSEVILKHGRHELGCGHFAICVEVKDRDEGQIVANLANKEGGHSFQHFGIFVDTLLTR